MSDGRLQGQIIEKKKQELREPDLYKVILFNDHYTSMEFVVRVIKLVFHKETVEATRIMMDVHKKGKGIVGMYIYDIAATKVSQVRQMANREEFPLRCSMEKA